MAICLATGGETLKHNLETASGQRLVTLMDELGSLCIAKATHDFQSYAAFVGHVLLPGADTESTDTQSHWLQLAVSICPNFQHRHDCTANEVCCWQSIRITVTQLLGLHSVCNMQSF